MDNPYQTFVDDMFSASNIRRCEARVFSLQTKLDKAVANNDTKGIRETFNLLAKNSMAVKVLAVYRITQRNQGKYTAGTDGVKMPKKDRDLQYQMRLKLLDEIDITRKPDPIKRTFIPKPNGKQRPLGIPTMRDRISQEILRIAVEPIAEYHFSDKSYGFRPKRSCHDAIEQIYNKLGRRLSYRYILEGDIKGCFDNINHDHIINTLRLWKVPIWATELIQKMLKSGIFYNGEVYESETGTPQGGVISPLLANVALTSLDKFCLQNYGKIRKRNDAGNRERITEDNPIVRYADDFIIVCKSKNMAEKVKSEISEHLAKEIGLTLSEEKTSITHITKGFNFLGFNIRKYPKTHAQNKPKSEREWSEYKLLIKPQKEKVIDFVRGCKEELDKKRTAKQETIVRLLTAKLKGWSMYYRHAVSKEVFTRVDYEIWHMLFRWSKRRHPNKPIGWVIRRYFSKVGKDKNTFRDPHTGLFVPRINRTPIKRFVLIRQDYRVYDKSPDTQEYWRKREYTNAFGQVRSIRMRRLYEKQKGKCSYCKEPLTAEQINNTELHTHHMLPRSLGGTEDYSNLRLLHNECHKELHARIPQKEMGELWKSKIDYLTTL